jgi:dihydroorotate dehydrogenase (fumarate)/dihydroorotate dehydrogenase
MHQMSLYKSIIRPVLFKTNPEKIHNFSISTGEKLGQIKPLVSALHSHYQVKDERLKSTICGIDFSNPVGLAAGYDKSGNAVPFLESLGYSHVEIGSVSAESSKGNPKPRLFRLPEDHALVVHYGLQNDGAGVIANRLSQIKRKCALGINIVKTNKGINALAESENDILEDYMKSSLLLKDHADYLTFNMSCPNTEMGRDFFGEKKHIVRFLSMLKEMELKCPVFLKISPVGGVETIERYLEAVEGFIFVSGFIFNLPPGKMVPLKTPKVIWEKMPGAVSGKPVETMLNSSIIEMYKRMDKSKYRLIGAGGIFTAEDAYLKIKLGCSLVQLLTGMVYNGPAVVKRINRGLLHFMEKDGLKNISEAVGTSH